MPTQGEAAKEILEILRKHFDGDPVRMSDTMTLAQATLFMHSVHEGGNDCTLDRWADSLAYGGLQAYQNLCEKNLN